METLFDMFKTFLWETLTYGQKGAKIRGNYNINKINLSAILILDSE